MRDREGYLLVDSGWDSEQSHEQLSSALRRLDSRPEEIHRVFATHVHRDHLGGGRLLRQRQPIWLTLGLGEREGVALLTGASDVGRQEVAGYLRRAGAGELAEQLLQQQNQQVMAGWEAPAPDLYLVGGELLAVADRELEVLATPGHTRGHLCLFDRRAGILFAGDHVLPHITPSIGVEIPIRARALAHFLDSLAAVRDLPATLVLPAHGPAFSDLRGRVLELEEHHRLRLELCLEMVQGGPRSSYQVAAALPWTRRRRTLAELDTFNQVLAVEETAAHLELLLERGDIVSLISDGEQRYAPADANQMGGS